MRVFVAGASGTIGRSLLPKLAAAGHQVTGTTRRPERAARIREAGAEPAIVDVYDAGALEAAVRSAAPEVVVHLLTALPARINPRSNYLAETNRVRTEGTRNLLAATRAAGARRLVAESVAFLYPPEGEAVKTEEDPVNVGAAGHFGEAMRALADLEAQVTGAEGIEAAVLRFGWLYGPGTHLGPDGTQTADIRRRRLPLVGGGGGLFSFVHVDDAASASAAAVESGATGIFNVTDDRPAPMSEWVPGVAEILGAKPPRRVPVWLARLAVGREAATAATSQRGASNAKAKRELGWEPRFPTWKEGFEDVYA